LLLFISRLRQQSGSSTGHNTTNDNSVVISGRVIAENREYFQHLEKPIELVFKHLVSESLYDVSYCIRLNVKIRTVVSTIYHVVISLKSC
jgi:hypothetical protein